nr:ABC transporter ATP-binding protein [Candidatus Contubernalis alkalaceticus]
MNGLDCRTQAKEIQKFLGYLPGEIAFFSDMTGTQFLKFMNEMRRCKDKTRTNNLIQRFELETGGRIRKMSKGMKQKLGIITAFMHDPEVYILDEPTSGLDPLMQRYFIDLIMEEKSRGKTILMSSHNFGEIDRTNDRAGIIREGRLVDVEDVHSLKASQRKAFLVTVASLEDVKQLQNSGLDLGSITDNHVEVYVSSNYDRFIETLAKCKVLEMNIPSQSLEQVFMKYYGQGVQ